MLVAAKFFYHLVVFDCKLFFWSRLFLYILFWLFILDSLSSIKMDPNPSCSILVLCCPVKLIFWVFLIVHGPYKMYKMWAPKWFGELDQYIFHWVRLPSVIGAEKSSPCASSYRYHDSYIPIASAPMLLLRGPTSYTINSFLLDYSARKKSSYNSFILSASRKVDDLGSVFLVSASTCTMVLLDALIFSPLSINTTLWVILYSHLTPTWIIMIPRIIMDMMAIELLHFWDTLDIVFPNWLSN